VIELASAGGRQGLPWLALEPASGLGAAGSEMVVAHMGVPGLGPCTHTNSGVARS
jgi:hypothetical protein